jgi:tetratricopeptide (TPR) repeat protein
VAPAEQPAAPRAARVDPSASFADLSADFADESAPPASPSAFDFETNAYGDLPSAARSPEPSDPFAAAAPPSGDGRADALLRRELESVDFYLAQGYNDIAADTLDMLERQFGHSPEIDTRRDQLRAGDAAGAETARDSFAPPAAPAASEFASDFAASSYGFADFGVVDETPEDGAAEEFSIDESSFAGFAVETPPPAATPASFGESSFGQTNSEPETFAPPARQPAPAQTVAPPAPKATTPAAPDSQLSSLFGEFLDAEQPAASNDEDFETHFNLGVAYREMHLWDEAVEQFQKAADSVSPDDGTPRYLSCCNMLGHCLADKGLPRAAAIWFKRALAIPGLNDDECQALRFDLATAYEAMGDIDRALDTLTEIYAVDVSYRGVAERLRELQTRKVGVGD